MNVLIIGSGAREHAIARAFERSSTRPKIYCYGTSFNPGIQPLTVDYHVGDITDVNSIQKKAQAWQIDLAIVGPEAPLEKGIADVLTHAGIAVIGPKKQLALIETSKAFARDLLKKYHVPGAPKYRTFHDLDGALPFLQQLGEGNYVIKANGLMGGKGVKVAGDHLHAISHAYQFCEELLAQKQSFVIEEKLIGQEFSMLCFCDGHTLVTMPLIQDHKRAFVNDEGPNTGGMGSYTDHDHLLPFLTEKDLEQAKHINESVLTALTAEYRDRYIGILYGSFIATKKGVYLIEYNARFGDPEVMNVLSILESDFVEICEAMVQGSLATTKINFAPLATVCKYAVPNGYPDAPVRNTLIDVSKVHHLDQLYYGAVDARAGRLYATGSRAVAVVGVGKTISEAELIAETEIARIQGELFHRPDIGTKSLIEKRILHMKELRQS